MQLEWLTAPLPSHGAFVLFPSCYSLFSPRLVALRPVSALGVPPSVDDGSSDAPGLKMVVSCLHNGSG